MSHEKLDEETVPAQLTDTSSSIEKASHSEEGVPISDRGSHNADVHLLSKGMLKLYVVWIAPFTATFMAGFGISTMTAINSMDTYQSYFDFRGMGVSTGLVFSLWPMAACATFWIGPPIADKFGRRGGMFISSLVFLIGTVLVACAQNVGMLMAGRALLGAGTGMIQPSAPPYIVELAPPMNRGMLTGAFNTFWLLGSCVATAISIATNEMGNDWAWRAPLFIGFVAITALFLPESPRWLYANNQPDRARAVLVRFHGDGEYTSLVAKGEAQIQEALKLGSGKRCDYKGLVSTRGKRYRLMLALMMGSFGQLSGNALSMFLPILYRQVGVTSVRSQLTMTLVASLVSLVLAAFGTYQTDTLGRRKMLITGTSLCALFLSCAMICSSQAKPSPDTNVLTDPAATKGAIAFLIIFGAAYAWSYTPLQATYPAEVLSTEMRSAGMGCMVLVLNLSSVMGQLTTPIALDKIGYWTYLPWICWDVVETAAWYFLAVETKGRTLEELDEVNRSSPICATTDLR
ncbi:hypothetical protein IAT38_002258 [Cryptococcus sp. DSM 104549]